MPFVIKHPLDFQNDFNIPPDIKPLIPPALLRFEEGKLGFPEPQHIGRKLGQAADFADLIEDLASQPWFIPHDRSSWLD
jgi:hypothetical protein